MSLLDIWQKGVGFWVFNVFCRNTLGKRRSRTMFFHITLADILVTLFPITGCQSENEWRSFFQEVFLPQARWSGRSWTAGWRAGCSASSLSFSRPTPSPPPTTWSSPSPWSGTGSHQWNIFLSYFSSSFFRAVTKPLSVTSSPYRWDKWSDSGLMMDHCWLSDYPFLFVWLLFPPRLRVYEAFLRGRVVVIILTQSHHSQVYPDRVAALPGPLGP